LTDYLGREAVVLFFFSTSSRSCLPLMPHLTRWSEERRGDVVILGIAMDGPDTIAEVPAFRHRHNVTFPVGLDDDSHVARLYNPRKADPFLVFIDWRGNVIGIRDGYIPGDERDIQETISRAVRPP
jgi:peroxiredoxin